MIVVTSVGISMHRSLQSLICSFFFCKKKKESHLYYAHGHLKKFKIIQQEFRLSGKLNIQ